MRGYRWGILALAVSHIAGKNTNDEGTNLCSALGADYVRHNLEGANQVLALCHRHKTNRMFRRLKNEFFNYSPQTVVNANGDFSELELRLNEDRLPPSIRDIQLNLSAYCLPNTGILYLQLQKVPITKQYDTWGLGNKLFVGNRFRFHLSAPSALAVSESQKLDQSFSISKLSPGIGRKARNLFKLTPTPNLAILKIPVNFEHITSWNTFLGAVLPHLSVTFENKVPAKPQKTIRKRFKKVGVIDAATELPLAAIGVGASFRFACEPRLRLGSDVAAVPNEVFLYEVIPPEHRNEEPEYVPEVLPPLASNFCISKKELASLATVNSRGGIDSNHVRSEIEKARGGGTSSSQSEVLSVGSGASSDYDDGDSQ